MIDSLKLKAWLCLKYAPGLRGREIYHLLDKWPEPQDFVGNRDHPIYLEQDLKPETRNHLLSTILPANYPQICKLIELHKIKMLCFTDVDYPLPLREIYSPPLILYYRGDLLTSLQNKCLAVVGTRKPTPYGRELCHKTISPACRQKVTIISGLAIGIDTVSHLAALENKSLTVAVLASGVDTIYPPQNRELALKVVENGALVSEYEPGTKLERWNFPARNRIVSALAQAVFVVEGGMSSGAMLTAKYAIEQDRELMALPGQVNYTNAQGPNYLIKYGARLISCPEDVLEAMGLEMEEDEQLQILPEISEDEQKVLDIFQNEQRELFFDELLLITSYKFGKLSIILLNLELKGYLAKASGNSFVLR